MGCLLAILAAISPRLALVLVWIFTNLVDRAFTGFLLPLLGLIFLPLTTLLYVLAYRPVVGVSGWGWFLVFLGLLVDLGSYGGGALGRRRR
jgi:CDP-diglyceride synthetase